MILDRYEAAANVRETQEVDLLLCLECDNSRVKKSENEDYECDRCGAEMAILV